MAKILHPVSHDLVKGMRGKLDFYFQRGVQVVRTWPKKSNLIPTAQQAPIRAAFRLIGQTQKQQGPQQRKAWQAWHPPKGQTWCDYVHRVWIPPAMDGTLFCVPDFTTIKYVPGHTPNTARLLLAWPRNNQIPADGFRIVWSENPPPHNRWRWRIIDYKIQRGQFRQPRWTPVIPGGKTASPHLFSHDTCEAIFDLHTNAPAIAFAVIPTTPKHRRCLLTACVIVRKSRL